MIKAALHTLGCKVNAYETEAMEQKLAANGYTIVPFDEVADVYIINTCTVTNIADRKSRQMLHKAKKMNENAIVVAVGCYVQAAHDTLVEDPYVDIVVGNNKKGDIVTIIDEYMKDHNNKESVIDIGKEHDFEKLEIDRVNEHTRAYIKVQDGCNQFCSYCIIPYARGRVRSRNIDDVCSEVTTLVNNGYKEIVLTGIHLSSYGIDFEEGSKETLLSLIVRLNDIEGLKRIRLGSLEPRVITEEFAQTLSSLDKICPHFHLSLQSGCDATLKRMNRKYLAEEFYEKCILLRKYFKNPALTTDVIVGFPGETEEEFAITEEFLRKVRFYEMHVFKYSKRQGTVAATMKDQVDEQIKTKRSQILIKMDEELSEEYRESVLGNIEEVLLEEEIDIDGMRYMIGHTKTYIKVVVPMSEELRSNMIILCKMDKIMDGGLILGLN